MPNPAVPQLFNRYSYAGNNPVLYNDPDGHCGPLCWIALGAGVSLIVNYGFQVYDNMNSNGMTFWNAVYHKNINEGAMAGAAAGGAIFAGTMAIAAPASLWSTTAWGSVGGLAGGQTGRFVQATWEEAERALSGNRWDTEGLLARARDAGFLDTNSMIIDAASGAVSALAGRTLESVLIDAGFLDHPSVMPRNDKFIPMVELGYKGNGIRIYNGIKDVHLPYEEFYTLLKLLENGAYRFAVELVSEWVQVSTGEVIENCQDH